jgi:hypothetical protein
VGVLFSLETISFVLQKLFNFMYPHLSISTSSFRIWKGGAFPVPFMKMASPNLTKTVQEK